MGIQTRGEGLRITNDMSRLTLPKERNLDYAAIGGMTNTDVRNDVIKDEQQYVALYQEFSLDLIDYVESKNDLSYRAFFNSPGVFDGLINILVQELRRSPVRPYLLDK